MNVPNAIISGRGIMNVPYAIIERRAERERWAERHRDAIENHQRSLAIVEAELDCICFAIAAIEDAAKAPNAEAVEGEGGVAGRVVAAEGEIAPAGIGKTFGGGAVLGPLPSLDRLEMARQALVGFLTRTPYSTMDEIREAGIEAAEVWRAEKEGVVFAKAHGLYALVESADERSAAE